MKYFPKKHSNLLKNKSGSFSIAKLNFGQYGLQAMESGILTADQLEIVRRVIVRLTNRRSKIWMRTKVNMPITAKPREIRMGKGKGEISQRVRYVTRGEIILEIALIEGVINILNTASKKLPVNTRIIERNAK